MNDTLYIIWKKFAFLIKVIKPKSVAELRIWRYKLRNIANED